MSVPSVFAQALAACRARREFNLAAANNAFAGIAVKPRQSVAESYLLLVAPSLSDATLLAVRQALPGGQWQMVHAGTNPASVTGASHEALIIALVPDHRAELALPTLADCRRVAAALNVDIGLSRRAQPWRWPAGAIFDMDSTLITMEVIDELALAAGPKVGAQVAAITEAAMRGELDFNASLQARVQALAGLPLSVIEQVRQSLRFNAGVVDFAAAARAQLCRLAVVSGGFVPFAETVQMQLNFDFARANSLEDDGMALTGAVLGEIVNAQVKADTLRALACEWACPVAELMAIGDGANDALMLDAAGFSVAFRAKPALRERADLALDVCDMAALTALFVDEAPERSER